MTRLYRLLSPGIIFSIIGAIVLANGQWPWLQLRGALTTVGLYALALQIVLSALLISAIDDLSGSGLWYRAGRGTGMLLKISTRPISFWRAAVEFYRRPFWPAFLLGFGLAASLSAFTVGVFREDSRPFVYFIASVGMHLSEATLGVVVMLGAALMWWRGGASYYGWVIGVCLATAAGQVVFGFNTSLEATVVSWGALMIGLCLLRLLVFLAALAGIRLRPGHQRTGRSRTAHADPDGSMTTSSSASG